MSLRRVDPDSAAPHPTARPLVRSPSPRGAALARAMGNRAFTRLLSRAPPTGGTAVGPRVVMVDGLIFDQINRGNKAMATALRAMKASGARIVIGESVEQEFLKNVPDAQMRAAHEAMVRDFGIEVNPADLRTTPAQRAPFATELRASVAGVKDTKVASEAMASGAEFWSTDVSYRKNPASVAKLKDLHMAPESATDLVPRNAHWSYTEGRELLGLEPITVGADGSVTRGVKPASVGTVVRGGQTREVMPGSRVRGEVDVKAEGGGTGAKATSGPTVAVDDPALRGQVTSGTTTTHVSSGTTVSGEIGGGPRGGGAITGGEILKTEGTLIRGGGRVGTVLGKIGGAAGWVADFLMPGPQDAIMLLIQFASVYTENREEARQRGWHAGFPDGFAAGLVFASEARTFARNELVPHTVSMDVVTEVAGTTGSWETGYVRGLADGIELRNVFSQEQRTAMRDYAVRQLHAQGFHWNSETWFSKTTVSALADAIGPTLFQIVDEAEQARDKRNTQAMVIYDPRIEYTVPPLHQ